ncbi:glycosyltransferase family 4 protein [Marivirga sp. S37H4]|uniref:Glycosyltransferase family 4 protein n=1 Tax=Marivirga aurantiaca TaxID=2802615 RepID=A0A935CBN8_9BACT|nr:glycosyltransferase family 4 protein [Marivirga aurantiaca]MBK6267189.1 glycosyltransferase family 4 protein [Marivirga aurantiaca]
MNILILCSQGGIAGSTYSISYLANGLGAKGHNVWIGLKKDSFLESLIKKEDVNVIPLPFNGKLDNKTRKSVRKLIAKENIEIINAQASNDRYLGPLINLFRKEKVLIVQTRRQHPKQMPGINQFLQNIFNNYFSDYLVTVSHELKRIFVERGIKPAKIKVIHNGTPTNQYVFNNELSNSLKHNLGYREDDIIIGCVARYKNQPQLVKALQYLPKEWKVLYVGLDEESYRERFPNEPDILDVPQEVICTGIIEDKAEVIQYYTLMNVNVLPSTMDGFGLTLVESMAMGTPVVATNYSGIKDVVQHEENGLLYENENYEDFAEQIKKAVSDQQLRKKIIKKGYETAFEKFSIENTIDNYESFFKESLQIQQLKKRK